MRAHCFSFLLLVACHDDPWTSEDAPKVRPDEEFRTGTEAGFDVWIWHCYEGQRIVIMQHGSAFFGAGRPQTTTGPCGAPLSVESKFPPSERQNEIPEGYRWP